MSLKKNISLSFLTQIINLIAGFALSILISRILGAKGRGEYVLVTTSAGFLVQFFTLGIDSSISHFIAANKTELKRLISTIVAIVLAISFFLIGSVIATAFFKASFLVPDKSIYYFGVLISLSIFMLFNGIYSAIFSGVRRFRSVLIISSATQMLSLLLCATFFFYSRSEVDAKLVLTLLVSVHLFIFIIYTTLYARYIGVYPAWKFIGRKETKLFFSYSLISFGCSVLQYLSYKMDFWVVNYYWGEQNLGVYSLSSSLVQLLWILPQSIAMILFPMSSYYNRAELISITGRISRISIFITFLIIVFLLGTSPFFIPFVFGGEFIESVKYFQLFLIGVLPFVLIKILASVFAGIGKVYYNFIATATGFVFGAIGYLLFIPKWGLIGGVIGSIMSYLATTMLGVYLYKREFKMPISDILFLKNEDVRYLLNQIRLRKSAVNA